MNDTPTAAEAVEAARRALPHVRLAEARTERAAEAALRILTGQPAPEFLTDIGVRDIDVANALIERCPEPDEFLPGVRMARLFAWAARPEVSFESAAHLAASICIKMIPTPAFSDEMRRLPEWRLLHERITQLDNVLAGILLK